MDHCPLEACTQARMTDYVEIMHSRLWAASLGLSGPPVSMCLSEALWASLGACSDGQFDDIIIIIIFWEHKKMVGLDAPKRHLKSSRRPKKAPKRLVLSTLGLSGPLYIGLSGPLCASLCLSEALWASLGFSGSLL